MAAKQQARKRHFTHGSGGAMADAAVDLSVRRKDHLPSSPHARKAKPLQPGQKPDQLADKAAHSENRQEALLDEGVEESFPASDPVSVHHIT